MTDIIWQPDPYWAANNSHVERAIVGDWELCLDTTMEALACGEDEPVSWDLFHKEGGEGHRRLVVWGHANTIEDAKATAEAAYRYAIADEQSV
jgi:hypothetical protein